MTASRRWWLLGIGGGILTLVVCFLLIVNPARNSAAELHTRAEEQEITNQKLKSRLSQYRAQEGQLPQKRAEIAEVQEKMPPSIDQQGMLRQLQDVGASAGVIIEQVSPGTPEESEDAKASPYIVLPLGINASGSYSQIKAFVNGLERMDRAYLITQISVTAGGEQAGGLSVEMQGDVFSLPMEDAASRSPAPSGAPAPGSSATPAPSGAPAPATPAPSTTTEQAAAQLPKEGNNEEKLNEAAKKKAEKEKAAKKKAAKKKAANKK